MAGSYCGSCRSELVPGGRFCASCGAPAATAPPELPAPGATASSEQAPPVAAEDQGAQPHLPPHAPPAAAAGAPAGATAVGVDRPPAPRPYSTPPPPPPPVPAPPPYSVQHPPPGHPVGPGPYGAEQGPYHGQPGAYAGPQPQYPEQQAHFPGQQPYASQSTQQPWTADAPYAATAAQAPWGAPTAGPPQQAGARGRSALDTLLTGDWGGAARAAAISVGAMLAVSLVGMLFLTEGGIGFRETTALVLAGACLAVGGDAYAEADAESFGTSASLGLLPLTVTLVGLVLLGRSFAKQVRRLGPSRTTDVLLHGLRTALVFTALFLPLALLTRYRAEGTDSIGVVGRLGVGVVSTLIGALLFAVAVLGLTALLHRSTVLPGRLGTIGRSALAPLLGAVAVFSVGVLAVLAALVYGLIEEDGKIAQLGVALLAGGNGVLASVLWLAGVPLGLEGAATLTGTPLGSVAPTGSNSVTLFTFTDGNAWFWLGPVVLLVAMLLVATALVVRQDTIEDARREGLRFAGALALVAFIASLLLRIGVDGSATEFSTAAGGSAMFNPLLAAVVLGIWGVLTGLLAPVLAAKVSGGFVANVRRRFGSAAQPAPPSY